MTDTAADNLPVITLINPSTGAKFDFRGRWLRSSPAADADIKAGRAQYRGDKVYLPLPPGVQAQVDKGNLRYASPDDEQLAGAASEIPGGFWPGGGLPMPPSNASHEHWRDYAIGQGLDPHEAGALTRDQIRMRFVAPGADRDDAPDVEFLDQDPGARAARKR